MIAGKEIYSLTKKSFKMGMLKEFKEFAMKGNIIDLAVAFVIGAAFAKIITELVAAIIMPIISLILGKGGVADMTFTVGVTIFPIGRFIQAVIDFILVAFILFLIIKGVNKMQKKKVAAPPELTTTEKLLIEIRDSLRR
jgi:large conductance mechanosensitive channel